MKRKHLLVLLLVLLITAVPMSSALAAPPFQEDRIVEEGETIRNDVIIFDGGLTVADGGTITGDVVLFNGSAAVDGMLKGDLVLFNGDLTAGETAVIHGDCIVFNGSITDQSAGGLGCTNIAGMPFAPALAGLMSGISAQIEDAPPMRPVPPVPDAPGIPGAPREHRGPIEYRDSSSVVGRFVAGTFGAVARALLFAALAFVVVALAPTHLQQIESTIRHKPVASGTVGFLTAVAVPALAVILALISLVLLLICIGIVGFAVVFVMLAGLGIAGLLGWIAMGDLLGKWLAGRLGWHKTSPAMVAALGVGLLTFALGFLSAVPSSFGVGLVSMIISFIGLGAVALTKFGSRPYPLVRFVGEDDVDDIKIRSVLDTLPDDE